MKAIDCELRLDIFGPRCFGVHDPVSLSSSFCISPEVRRQIRSQVNHQVWHQVRRHVWEHALDQIMRQNTIDYLTRIEGGL